MARVGIHWCATAYCAIKSHFYRYVFYFLFFTFGLIVEIWGKDEEFLKCISYVDTLIFDTLIWTVADYVLEIYILVLITVSTMYNAIIYPMANITFIACFIVVALALLGLSRIMDIQVHHTPLEICHSIKDKIGGWITGETDRRTAPGEKKRITWVSM